MKNDVTKVLCTLWRSGRNAGLFHADMIYIDDEPHVVFEWDALPDGGEKPMHLVKLDRQFLHPLPGWGEVTMMYEKPVEDPRTPALH